MEETFTYVSVKEEKRALDVFNEERMLWDLKIYTFDIWWVNGSHLFFCAKLQPLIYFFYHVLSERNLQKPQTLNI